MTDSDEAVARLSAALDAVQDKLRTLPIDWDKANDALMQENFLMRKDIERLRAKNEQLKAALVKAKE